MEVPEKSKLEKMAKNMTQENGLFNRLFGRRR